MKCSKCDKPAVVVPREINIPLCKDHFIEYIERQVVKAVRKHKMFKYDDYIGVAYSGGKDSTVLLYILSKIERKFPHSNLIALIVDEGIHGYRDSALKIAIENAKKFGVDYEIITFKELYGFTLDEIIKIASQKLSKRLSACTYCGVLRRYAIEYLARKVGVSKIATGHNLDDESETFLLNIARGDLKRIGRLSPAYEYSNEFIPRVKPLRYVSEENVVLYAYFQGLNYHYVQCPYASESLRNIIRSFIISLSERDNLIKFKLIGELDEISQCFKLKTNKEFMHCVYCGFPTSSPTNVCRKCQLLRDIGILSNHLNKIK
ncbi:MAG: TIGR00269 family protein [Candidatus Asgardarchaeia archaeon]